MLRNIYSIFADGIPALIPQGVTDTVSRKIAQVGDGIENLKQKLQYYGIEGARKLLSQLQKLRQIGSYRRKQLEKMRKDVDIK